MATHKIVAKDNSPKKAEETSPKKATSVKVEPVRKKTTSGSKKRRNPISSFFGYFEGAWHELKEVRWPNRKASWSLTLAVIVFVVFFTLLISLLDALYKYLFQLILK